MIVMIPMLVPREALEAQPDLLSIVHRDQKARVCFQDAISYSVLAPLKQF
jgi:hypothetical protein